MFKSLINVLKGFVLSKMTGVAAGVVAILVLIWFLGAHVGLTSVKLKIIAMVAVVLIFMVFLILRLVFLSIRGRKFKKQLDSVAGDSSPDTFQAKISDVLAALKSTHLGASYRGDRALYALPWYMVIGPSAAGKSTLFARSGLEFPLKDDERFHVQGIGGTRDCDWWFSDQAILIDTAGRYTSDEDNEEWLNFLRVLKSSRSKLPINGLLLALPLDEILTSDRDTLEQHVKYLKNRLHELISELGVTFPIYIVITKIDLLKGFEAFFNDLSEVERKRPWGVYLLEDTEDKSINILNLVEERLEQLYHRLLEQSAQKINLATSTSDKVEIFQFPNQFAGAKEKLSELLSLLFKNNPYHENPWFAGIYFTSSTQEGVLLERRSNALKNMFSKVNISLPRTDSITRSYFIDKFFSDVIFPLKNAVRGNRKKQRWDRTAKVFTFVFISALLVVSGVGLFSTYTANQMLISDYEKKASTLISRVNDPNSTEQQQLDALVGLYQHYQRLEQIQTYSPLQLIHRYSLIESHAVPMKRLLLDTLTNTVNAHVVPALKARLTNYTENWSKLSEAEKSASQDKYYFALRAYLMLTSNADRLDTEFLDPYLSQIWYESYSDTDLLLSYKEQQPLLKEMMGLYLTEVFGHIDETHTNPWLAGVDLVTASQLNLTTKANAQTIYDRLVASSQDKFPAVTIDKIIGREGRSVIGSSRQVDGIYTKNAWRTYIAKQIDEMTDTASRGDWVLGAEQSQSREGLDEKLMHQLRADVRNLYFEDFSREWSEMLRNTTVKPYKNLAEAVQALKILGNEQSPWMKLFNRVADELTLTEPELDRQLIAEVAATNNAAGKESVLDKAPVPVIPAFKAATKPLAELVRPENYVSTNAAWGQYQEAIATLGEELEFILASSDVNREAKEYSKSLVAGKDVSGRQLYASWIAVNNILLEMDPGASKWVEKPFKAPLNYTWSALLGSARAALQQQWETQVYQSYVEKIQGRFPFSQSQVDAAPLDVQTLLTPQTGELWRFVQDELEPFIKFSKGRWRSRTWLNQGLTFNSAFFDGLIGADRLSRALFKPGSSEMGMAYALYPIPVPGVTESIIEVDGSTYRYRNEPQEWREFSWLPSENHNNARVVVRQGNQSSPYSIEVGGQWALIRLLQKADVKHIQGTEFELKWSFGSQGEPIFVKYRVRSDREGSVLNTGMFSSLGLPRKLFGAS
ncbi:type VI secretion system membrane subunit TssM [Gynuella sunshinyii]|uniref:IcmF-related protein n=1 Tax=Gynuella sunshinyii YC6258 TaxID=1445510 RepID=A0A0C5V2U8_9GAMM|nr:type VI secretion system membrane subunit TssM [Gynuella sunshinyii]AJQ93820.1 hypothetical protein YC6258_01776 [Gynuella sunshinyii YC6258]